MISHAWCCNFNDLVAAIECHVNDQKNPDNYYVLLDFCTLNQHTIAVTLTDMVTGPSDNLLVLVLDSWSKATLLTRCWCLFEAAMAHKNGVEIKATMQSEKLQVIFNTDILTTYHSYFCRVCIEPSQLTSSQWSKL
jgi:hypothetical protein